MEKVASQYIFAIIIASARQASNPCDTYEIEMPALVKHSSHITTETQALLYFLVLGCRPWVLESIILIQ